MFGNFKFPRIAALTILVGSVLLFGEASTGQHTEAAGPASAAASANRKPVSALQTCVGCELPVVLRQNVEAGKTPVGTKVEARLVMATMINSVVVPKDAMISGEVTESVAKSDKSPSRLGIRMAQAQWKSGSASFQFYLTAWYYPPAPMAAQNLSYAPAGDRRNWGGVDPTVDTTDPPNPAQRMSTNQDNGMNVGAPASVISNQRVSMKNVESTRGPDGSVVLVSSHSNIKLNKSTTYVLAVSGLVPGK